MNPRWLAIPAVVLAATTLSLGCGHRGEPTRPVEVAQVATPARALHLERANAAARIDAKLLGTPVRSVRTWTKALAPNKHGGWNFITQAYEPKSPSPSEWVVVDLDTGAYTTTEGPSRIYASHVYDLENEIIAPNGRVFFPEVDANMAYYDPADEKVHELGPVVDPGDDAKVITRVQVAANGKLYGTTQSSGLPTVFELDPVTLHHRVLGKVGQNQPPNSFGYYMIVDLPWIYVAVGETIWELAAINVENGTSKVLATRRERGFIHFERHKQGIVAKLVTDNKGPAEKDERVWCVDGTTYPFDPAVAALPFSARDVRAPAGTLPDAPEVDLTALDPDSNGVGRVRWRPHGSTGPWTERTFQLKYTTPVDIESLLALPDGTLLGNAREYHGFFRYEPRTHAFTFYGEHGPSRGPRIVYKNLVYIAGYPRAVLYAYDPSKPWTSNRDRERALQADPSVNPHRLGRFEETGTHYAERLVGARNGRLYYLGRRERDGLGSGIGYYDVATGKFAGHHDGLGFYDPRGLVVLDESHQVVLSGRVRDLNAQEAGGPGEAQLFIYDEDLREQERMTVRPGLVDTGVLFRADTPTTVLGLVRDDQSSRQASAPAGTQAVYRFDIATAKLAAWIDLPGHILAWTQRDDDHSLWLILDGELIRVDAATLAITRLGQVGPLDGDVGHLVWQGNDLYLALGSELRQLVLPTDLLR